MKNITGQINLKQHRPIHISLIGGNIELLTHPELSIKIDAGNMMDMNLVPQIIDRGYEIEIGKQSIPGFLFNSETIRIKIYVPDESFVTHSQISGSLSISGSYRQLSASLTFGAIKIKLDDFSLEETASLELSAGDVRIYSDDSSLLKQKSGSGNFQVLSLAPRGTIAIHSTVGNIKYDLPIKKYVYRFNSSLQ